MKGAFFGMRPFSCCRSSELGIGDFFRSFAGILPGLIRLFVAKRLRARCRGAGRAVTGRQLLLTEHVTISCGKLILDLSDDLAPRSILESASHASYTGEALESPRAPCDPRRIYWSCARRSVCCLCSACPCGATTRAPQGDVGLGNPPSCCLYAGTFGPQRKYAYKNFFGCASPDRASPGDDCPRAHAGSPLFVDE